MTKFTLIDFTIDLFKSTLRDWGAFFKELPKEFVENFTQQKYSLKWTYFNDAKPIDGEWCLFVQGVVEENNITEVDEIILIGKYCEKEKAFRFPDYNNHFYGGIVKYAPLKHLLDIQNL